MPRVARPVLIPLDELATRTGIPRIMILRVIKAGKMPGSCVGDDDALIPPDAIDRYQRWAAYLWRRDHGEDRPEHELKVATLQAEVRRLEARLTVAEAQFALVLDALRNVRLARRMVAQGVRQAVFARDKNECRYCAEILTARTRTIDHIIPVSRGGTDEISNLVTACASCNSRKKARLIEEAGMRLLSEPI